MKISSFDSVNIHKKTRFELNLFLELFKNALTVSGVSGDLGGCTELTLVLKGLVDLERCTEEALEPRFPFPLELEMESRSSALPIFSNMARALLNRAWWLSVLETEATTEVLLGSSLMTGESLVLDFFRRTTVSLFWNLLAIWETRPSLMGFVGAKTPPPASVDSLCFICNEKHRCFRDVGQPVLEHFFAEFLLEKLSFECILIDTVNKLPGPSRKFFGIWVTTKMKFKTLFSMLSLCEIGA